MKRVDSRTLRAYWWDTRLLVREFRYSLLFFAVLILTGTVILRLEGDFAAAAFGRRKIPPSSPPLARRRRRAGEGRGWGRGEGRKNPFRHEYGGYFKRARLNKPEHPGRPADV